MSNAPGLLSPSYFLLRLLARSRLETSGWNERFTEP